MGLVSMVKTLGVVACQMAKPFTDKGYSAKQNVKNDDDNISMQIIIHNIIGKSIITLLNKLPYLSNSEHFKSRYIHLVIKVLKFQYGF